MAAETNEGYREPEIVMCLPLLIERVRSAGEVWLEAQSC